MHSTCCLEPSLSIWTRQACCGGARLPRCDRGATSAAARAASPNSKRCLRIIDYCTQCVRAQFSSAAAAQNRVVRVSMQALWFDIANLGRKRDAIAQLARQAEDWGARRRVPCATARLPGGVGEDGCVGRGVQRRDAHRARSRRGPRQKQPQGPNTAGAVAWDPVVCRRGRSPCASCASAWLNFASSCAQTAKAAYSPRKIVISGIQRVFDAPATGSIAQH